MRYRDLNDSMFIAAFLPSVDRLICTIEDRIKDGNETLDDDRPIETDPWEALYNGGVIT